MKLAEALKARDNNFNLLRALAAFAVLVSHCSPISLGANGKESLMDSFGFGLGTLAVDIFFISSGLLVTQSLCKRDSVSGFLWARFLRIFPALALTVLLTVFVMGPLLTRLSLVEYFADARTWLYLRNVLIFLTGLRYELPGVFESNPHALIINGSLWTLPYELKMYVSLALLWALIGLSRLPKARLVSGLVLLFTTLSYLALAKSRLLSEQVSNYQRLSFMFFAGSSTYFLRHSIPLSKGSLTSLLALLICIMTWTFWKGDPKLLGASYALLLPYFVLCVAFLPGGVIRRFNGLGDYSYGIYIYAFPIQQSLVALMPGIQVLETLLYSSILTVALAVFSWHVVEKPALRFKSLI